MLAFGQMATGVVAVGQLARGVIAVGQLAVGVFVVGQGVVALGWGLGMVGVAGRGKGIVLRMLPKYRRDRGAPALSGPLIAPDALGAPDAVRDAWVRAEVRSGVLVSPGGGPLPISLPEELAARARAAGEAQAAVRVEAVLRVSDAEASYRLAPRRTMELRAVALETWSPWPWPFEAIAGDRPAPLYEVALRLVGFVVLACAVWLLCGSALSALFR